MVKASDVIGRQITVREGGQDVGRIKDLIVDPSGKQVMGLLLADGVFSGSRVVPWEGIQAFGPDNVIVDVASRVVAASAVPQIKAVLDQKTEIKGLRLVTTQGKDLGKIADFEFDETTGVLTGFDLSGGLFSFEGTPFLPAPDNIELGKDVAFVDPAVEATIKAGESKNPFKRGGKEQEGDAPVGDEPVAADGGAVPPAGA